MVSSSFARRPRRACVTRLLTVTGFLQACLTLLSLAGSLCVFGQSPTTCTSVTSRANSNGMASSCANVSGTSYAANFTGTTYATAPASGKTGNMTLSYTGSNPLLTPYAITRVWLTTTGSTLQTVVFGPAGVPAVSGGNTQVSYCFYNTNLPTAGTLSLEMTNPQTGVVWGICSYDASCNSNCVVVANPGTLPVKFSYFSAAASPLGSVQLRWATAQEENNKGFTVERSPDDSSFSSIGFVPTSDPGGNSAGPATYTYTDVPPAGSGTLAYRLRQDDLGGPYSYSDISLVELGPAQPNVRIGVSPTGMSISFSAGSSRSDYDLVIYTAQGAVIRKQTIGTGSPTNVGGLSGGMLYFVTLQPRDGTRRIVRPVYLP